MSGQAEEITPSDTKHVPDQALVDLILQHHPKVQAVYLFGSYSRGEEWPESDVDIALLFSPEEADGIGLLALSELYGALEDLCGRDIDLINLRRVPTVFQKEIIMNGRRIHCADPYAAEEFEMLVLSYYQQLNEERADILADGLQSGRFYNV
ncbi:MAG: nucleotidyltransferase domain-containing protein [Candidatus Hydrogenedentes bacterium]|nr:nucleotidyltransferase domain-containing protein [Candidatus Hydrogenedentota bacterium]